MVAFGLSQPKSRTQALDEAGDQAAGAAQKELDAIKARLRCALASNFAASQLREQLVFRDRR